MALPHAHALAPVRTSAPGSPIITLAQAKAHLRVEHAEEDDLIFTAIEAATNHLDGWSGIIGRCLINQQWVQAFPWFETHALRLPFPDVSEVVVSYYDAENVLQPLPPEDYHLINDRMSGVVVLAHAKSWPQTYSRPNAVSVQMVAGYGPTAASVPQAIRSAALLIIGDLYQHRESVVIGTASQPIASAAQVSALIAPHRRIHL